MQKSVLFEYNNVLQLMAFGESEANYLSEMYYM